MKATDDAFNNNNGGSCSNSDFHSTALIKDIIHKKPRETATAAVKEMQIMHPEEVQKKTEIDERMTNDLTNNTYMMSISAKTSTTSTTTKIKALQSFESRERDYTYDDAIEDYKTRVSKTTKLDLPKVDINKRRELFEQQKSIDDSSNISTSAAAAKLGTEIVSIKDRISSLRSNIVTSAVTTTATPKKIEVPVSTKLKDRLSSLHQQVSSPVDEPKRILDTPFRNVQEARNEFEIKQQQQQQQSPPSLVPVSIQQSNSLQLQVKSAIDDNESLGSTDREDSGIHTTDVSCSVSQADEQQPTERIEEFQRVIQEKFTNINVSETMKTPDVIINATEAAKHHIINDDEDVDEEDEEEIHDHDGNDEESSVSCTDDEQNQSVMVISLDGDENITNKNQISTTIINLTQSPPTPPPIVKASNGAMMNFIQCNLIDDDDHPHNPQNEEEQPSNFDEQVKIDNNYIYECIINQSSDHHDGHHQVIMKSNGLEKSNSVDAALSLCSSSDGGASFMDECDDKIIHH